MSVATLPKVVEPLKLVEQGAHVQGKIALSQLPRLDDLLFQPQGEVAVKLDFFRDEAGIAVIGGQLAANAVLQCQRCMKAVTVEIASDVKIAIALSEASLEQLPKHYDPFLLEEAEIQLWDLVEEELILSLPIVAHHAETECSIDTKYQQRDDLDEDVKPNPFAVLSHLKRDKS